ncbi:MAG: M28 family metallopeptidase [Opitutaceae bacterium]|nr:M28 family metallopeptidase [Opitutaceae bacterium]
MLPHRFVPILLLATALPGTAAPAESRDAVMERQVKAHATFLADDLLEGRGAGTRGHALAMAYVSAQFQRLGLEPAGTEGFLQPMSFRESRLDREAGRLVLHHGGGETAFTMVTEALARPAAGEASSETTAPAIFAGFGIHAPESGYDDFGGGLDVRGKIVVVLAGSPTTLPATARAHYSRSKAAELAGRGAVGWVSVETPAEEKRVPWALQANRGRFPTMRLVEPDGSLFEAFPGLRGSASVSRAAAGKLFAHAPKTADEVFAAAARGEAQSFPLGVELTIAGRAAVSDAKSANVLGWLAGADPSLAGEPLVITAHLDHLGIGPAVDGDTIYNGLFDNAVGTAAMLAVAEELAGGPKPRRPVLFASLTAEEKGLLGAHYLARRPPPRVRRFAANLNIDMPVIAAAVRDVIPIGAEHSSLGAVLTAAAKRLGFTVSPDPQPEEVFFVRSDQYPFVRNGIPALYIKAGQRSTEPGVDLKALEAEFRKQRYHQPNDDSAHPPHWPSVGAFAALEAEVARAIADDPKAPAWNPGDFFGTRFGPAKDAPAGTR